MIDFNEIDNTLCEKSKSFSFMFYPIRVDLFERFFN